MKKLITTIACSVALTAGAWAQECVESEQPDTLWLIPSDKDLKETICVNINNKTYEGCKYEMVDGKTISIKHFNKRGQEIELSNGTTTELGLTCRKDGEREDIGFIRGCNMSLIVRRQVKNSNGEYYNGLEFTVKFDNHANKASERCYRFNENGDTISCYICKNVYDERYPCFLPVRMDEYTYEETQGEQHIVVTREYDNFENMTLEEVYVDGRLSEKTTLTIERDHKSRELKRKFIKTDYADGEWLKKDNVQSQTITTTYDDTTKSSFSIEEWENKPMWKDYGWNTIDTYSTTYTCQDSIVTENYERHHEYTNGESVYSWVLAEHLVTDRNNKKIRRVMYDDHTTDVYNYLADGSSAEMTQYDKEGKAIRKFDYKYDDNGTQKTTYTELNGKWVKCGEEFMSQDAYGDQWHLKFGTKIFTDYTLINGQYREVAKFMYDNRGNDCSYKMTNGEWKLYQDSNWSGSTLNYNAYYRICGQDTLIIKDDAVYKEGNWTTDYRYRQEYDGKLNDHAYVDLGLSSGTLWATANIGATHFYDNGCDFSIKEAKKDVAKAIWGKEWGMPTPDDWIELINECQWTPLMKEWIDREDEDQWVYGAMVTGPNGKTIFLPLQYSDECRNMYLWATDGYCCNYQNYYRDGHMPKLVKADCDWEMGIRPVAKKK